MWLAGRLLKNDTDVNSCMLSALQQPHYSSCNTADIIGNQQKNLVEFRAGKMTLKGSTVSPDKRKGLVYIYQSEDGLTHFCWKDRKSGTVEDDLIVFPDDCEYKKVTQCKEGSRVFLLKFKTSARKLFFWMQEPKADGDDDLVWKVNDSLNNPGGSGGNARQGGQSGSVTPTPSESEMQALISNMSQSQLMQLIGGMSDLGSPSGLLSHLSQQISGLQGSGSGSSNSNTTSNSSSAPATTTTTTTTPVAAATAAAPAPATQTSTTVPKTEAAKTSSSSAKTPASSQHAPIQLQDLQKILSNLQPAGGAAAAVDLSASVNGDLIRRITSSPATVKKLAPLLPQFGGPEVKEEGLVKGTSEEGCKTEVEETLLSPQFQHALSAFCAAFPTGQLGPLVSQFGMGSEAVNAAQAGNLEAFLNAIQQEVTTASPKEATPAAEGAEDMNVD
ncbi:unnamed protein product [Allacma fusca]|uniref:Proteasomal ubiquitin receptor ADRM1 homolog n=1 Tax=Allacma fusca TaxID=39272 RepID=A0A8J2NXN6_9HEXA|nr:unnamed protein product [Allacma fusca]